MKTALVIVLALLALPASASEAAVKRTVRANLDGDARKEGIQKITTTRPNPFGGTAPLPVAYVRVVDPRRGRLIKRRLSPRGIERASFQIRDLNRDGRPEVWFTGFAGNGFFSFGLYAWTGAARRILWRWDNNRSVVGRRSAGARVEFQDRDSSYPGREIVLLEGVLRPGEPRCCPSRFLVQLFGRAEGRRRYRLIDRYYTPASPAGSARRPATAAQVRDCHTWVYYPNLYISSVRNMSCRSAKREMRRYSAPSTADSGRLAASSATASRAPGSAASGGVEGERAPSGLSSATDHDAPLGTSGLGSPGPSDPSGPPRTLGLARAVTLRMPCGQGNGLES